MRYGIVGLGLTGQSVLRFLPSEQVAWGWDTRRDIELEPLQKMTDVPLYAGDLPETAWAEVDVLIVSPGIAVSDPKLQPARKRHLPMWGDIELFARHVRQPVIAITGSNGKSTVTTLVEAFLNAAGIKARAGGNLGIPALDLLQTDAEVYVLELSSFQLETTESLKPQAAAVLNLSEDHLDRYPSMAEYGAAKRRILAQSALAVLPEALAHWAYPEQPLLRFGLSEPTHTNVFGVAEGWLQQGNKRLFPIEKMHLPSAHMQLNALAALALVSPFVRNLSAVTGVLETFSGLPHRTEVVGVHQGVRWVNDSKGTNVGATLAALESFLAESPVILVAGGVGKGQDFAPLAEGARTCRHVILFGESAAEMAEAFGQAGVKPLCIMKSLDEALQEAARTALPGDTVLFSPACASFDQFANYQVRGETFKQWVKQHVSS